MKTFVTGATGFIGSALVRQLLDRGEEIKVLVRPESDLRAIEGLDLEVVQGDLRDLERLRPALKGCDRLYHVAGLYTLDDPPTLYEEVNVAGTANVLHAAVEGGVERMVHTSTTAAVGSAPPGGLADEETEWNLGDLAIPYIATKRRGEELALERSGTEMEVVVVNPSGPIGPGDVKPTPTGQILVSFLNGRMPLVPNTHNNFVDVDDVALGHIRAMERGADGQRYILGGQNLTVKELLSSAARMTGQRRPLTLPYAFAYLGGLLGEVLIQWILRRRTMVNRANVRYLRRKMSFSVDKARNELGIDPRPAAEAVARAIRWFCENGYVKKRRARKFLKRLEESRSGNESAKAAQ
jgi:dihydroflavonol-4-reductase